MMDKAARREIFYRQLGADYGCGPGEAADGENHFSVFTPDPRRRVYRETDPCFLKVAALNGKLLFTGREDILARCRARYEREPGEWFMDGPALCSLQELLRPFGCRVSETRLFLLPEFDTPAQTAGLDIRWYEGDEIEGFRGDARFCYAFTFDPKAPDLLGVSASREGRLLGMAGASRDSEAMWQIGINVMPEARGGGVASALVSLLRKALLDRGILPFYGTAQSHIPSLRTGLRAGFRPAWVELTTEKL